MAHWKEMSRFERRHVGKKTDYINSAVACGAAAIAHCRTAPSFDWLRQQAGSYCPHCELPNWINDATGEPWPAHLGGEALWPTCTEETWWSEETDDIYHAVLEELEPRPRWTSAQIEEMQRKAQEMWTFWSN